MRSTKVRLWKRAIIVARLEKNTRLNSLPDRTFPQIQSFKKGRTIFLNLVKFAADESNTLEAITLSEIFSRVVVVSSVSLNEIEADLFPK